MSNKASIPKGTRDFSPLEMKKRSFVMDVIKSKFQNFGFEQIETPVMENLSTLTGKYGDEGDQLMFKILDSGDFLKKVNLEQLGNSKSLTPQIASKALRYDLTVPFARYIVQNRNDITFPFKRYQLQAVWRADRPQRGRFREFYQCDADIIGTKSLLCEVELIKLYDEVFSSLGIENFTIKLNNRKILYGIAQVIGEEENLMSITTALDKLDKIGREGVENELLQKGFKQSTISQLSFLFELKDLSFVDKLEKIKHFLSDSELGTKGIEELSFIISKLQFVNLSNANIDIDLTLARGLNYYTGAIIEVVSDDVNIGSIGGGGRYDDLTGIFGLKNVSGVGVSIGFDRLCMVLEELNLFPEINESSVEIMFVNFGDLESNYCLSMVQKLRDNNVSSELYPSPDKIKKQMQYANKKSVGFVAIIGHNEIENNTITLKDMSDGSQKNINFEQLLTILKN